MIKHLSISGLLLFSIITGCSIQAAENDFDKVCGYFQQLQSLATLDTLTQLQRNDFILNKIAENLPDTSDARGAWQAVGYAVAEQRYDIFKDSAESVLNTPWSCPAMKQLAPTTGEF